MQTAPRSIFALLAALCASTGWLAACHYDWELPADSIDGAVDGSLQITSEGGGATDAGADAGIVTGGGCDASSACDPGFVCAYSDHRCGSGARGVCTSTASLSGTASCGGAVTSDAAATPSPIYACGCDGVRYSPPCTVFAAGFDVALNGSCGLASGGYERCGYLQCPTATTYCVSSEHGTTFRCEPWGSCGTKDCTCAKSVCDGGSCNPTSGGVGGVTITCP